MELIRCNSCGTEFDTKFCPECGNSRENIIQAKEQSMIPEGTPWWISDKLVGNHRSQPNNSNAILMSDNRKAALRVHEDGSAYLKVTGTTSTEEYSGEMKPEERNVIRFARTDGKGIGEGAVKQSGFRANIYRQNREQISLDTPTTPHPTAFRGFMFMMVRDEKQDD